MRLVAAHTLRESLRRRVFVVVSILSILFLGLYTWGASQLFADVRDFGGNQFGVEPDVLAGATVLGLAMFAILFLGTVLATFLTLDAVRGDADRGLLQPIVVRPLGRTAYLGGRLLAAGAMSAAYVVVLFGACVLVTGLVGWWPDRVVGPALGLAGAAVVVAALALLGSVVLGTTANGITIFMVFGAGLVAGLLGQLGEGLGSETLIDIGELAAWVLPFEALYQDGLAGLTADVSGSTSLIVDLGPFGGASEGGALLWPWAILYVAAAFAAAAALFARRDL